MEELVGCWSFTESRQMRGFRVELVGWRATAACGPSQKAEAETSDPRSAARSSESDMTFDQRGRLVAS